MTTKKSTMMTELYGEEESDIVYQRCEELSAGFNQLVQEVVYDIFWKRPGISLIEKSLVTILSLIYFNKEEQLRIHLKGFFNLGGSSDAISEMLHYMVSSGYIASARDGLAILKEASGKKSFDQKTLSSREVAMIDLIAHIAKGNQSETKTCLTNLLENKTLSREDIENILLHQVIYCGFPCAMNGFAVLKLIG